MYLRKSRTDAEAESRGEGETLARHEKTLLELAKKMKLNIGAIYKEIVSGETISARPVMQQLLFEVEEGIWDGVLVMEIERLARGNTIDQGIVAQSFKLSCTKIITPLKIFDPSNEIDEEYFEFGLFMSRREYKTINRRLQRGRETSVKEGKYVANQPPYGYNRKKLEKEKGFTLEEKPEEANIVKLIFNLYTIGELSENGNYRRIGVSLIANKLNSMNIPSKKGSKWTAPSIRDILINPVYIGKIRWNWRPATKKIIDGKIKISRPRVPINDCLIVDGLHSSIIEENVFNTAQNFISANPPRPINKNSVIKNSLAGIIVCGKCGRKMVRRPHSQYRNTPDTLMCPSTLCNNISCSLHYVEQRILASLNDWLGEYKLTWKCTKDSDNKNIVNIKKGIVKKLDKEINDIQAQINNIYDLLEKGIYSTETFLERSNLHSKKLEELNESKINTQNEIQSETEKEKSRRIIIPKLEKLLEAYDSLSSAQSKNDLLKEVLEKVVYTKEKNGRWHHSPDDFEIVLYPKIPPQNG